MDRGGIGLENTKALTAQDVADQLGIAKNTVYELIKRGEINSYKVGRKVRFTQQDIEDYIQNAKSRQTTNRDKGALAKASTLQATRPNFLSEAFILSGQDMALDILCNHIQKRTGGSVILRSYTGSYDSLVSLYKGEVQVAATHLWNGETDEYNLSYIRSLVPGTPVIVIHLAKRMQGFYVQKGNPKNILSWEDLKREGIRMINREKGAGARVLLDEKLRLMGFDGRKIEGYTRESSSHLAVASLIARGGADVGIGSEKVALQVEAVDFIPMQKERYDLVIKKIDLDKPQARAFLQSIESESFKMELEAIGGYDVSELGKRVLEDV